MKGILESGFSEESEIEKRETLGCPFQNRR